MIPLTIWFDPYLDIDCCVGAYQAISGPASLGETLTNLANPGTYDLLEVAAPFGTSPEWDGVHGWKFNSAQSNTLRTEIVPDRNYSYVVRFTNLNVYNTGGIFGTLSMDAFVDLFPAYASGCMRWYHGTDILSREPMVTEGIFGLAGGQPYRNGLPDGAAGPGGGWAGLAGEVYLGSLGGAWFSDVYIQAFAMYSCTLTQVQMANVMDAVAML
jgi:hypothetical protein